ncbi:MAG: hypothetical protein AAB209_13650, partial [Bacteroidota bacterium]
MCSLKWGLLALVVGSISALAQSTQESNQTARPSVARVIQAFRIMNPITVDGVLSEAEYATTPTSDFSQKDPDEG